MRIGAKWLSKQVVSACKTKLFEIGGLISRNIQTLKRVSEPSASIKVTVRLLIQISRAKRIGFKRATSLMGAVL